MTSDISFLVPVYNVAAYLDACVESILPALRESDELILVNDGSRDDSGRLCDEWRARHPGNIRVIHQPNGGLSAARNRAWAHASKSYVYFLDSDDLLCVDAFNAARAQLDAWQPDILTCDAWVWQEGQAFETAARVSHSLQEGLNPSREAVLIATFRDDFLSSSSRIFRRGFLAHWAPDVFPVGQCYEDNSTIPKLVAVAERIAYVPQAIFRYRIRQGSITQSHTLQRCIDQGSSFKSVLPAMVSSQQGLQVERAANILAFKHLVRAVRNAAYIHPITRRHFDEVIAKGLATLTLSGPDMIAALAAGSRADQPLLRHAKGMLRHRRRYAWGRMLAARMKQLSTRLRHRSQSAKP